MVQSVQHRNGYQSTDQRLRLSQRRNRIWNPVRSLMNAAGGSGGGGKDTGEPFESLLVLLPTGLGVKSGKNIGVTLDEV